MEVSAIVNIVTTPAKKLIFNLVSLSFQTQKIPGNYEQRVYCVEKIKTNENPC